MKKLQIKPFLCLLALVLAVSTAAVGCSRAFPGTTEADTVPTTEPTKPTTETTKPAPGALEKLRGELAQTDALFAVAYLGYMDAEPQGYLLEWVAESNPKLMAQYPFLFRFDRERCVGTVGEVYCIIPRSAGASVTVELLTWNGTDYAVSRELYRSESGKPVLVTCNGGAFTPDTTVTITEGEQKVVWYPGFADSGRIGLPFEGDKLLAKDISLYEAVSADPYAEYLQSGWLMPTEEGLKNTSWTGDIFVNGEPAWLFMDLKADGTARMGWATKNVAETQGVYTGTWRVYVENRNFLELELSGPNGATVSDAYVMYISPSGLDLILGNGIMGTELPWDVVDPHVVASFTAAVG